MLRISVKIYLTCVAERLQCLNGRGQFRAIVGRLEFETGQYFLSAGEKQ